MKNFTDIICLQFSKISCLFFNWFIFFSSSDSVKEIPLGGLYHKTIFIVFHLTWFSRQRFTFIFPLTDILGSLGALFFICWFLRDFCWCFCKISSQTQLPDTFFFSKKNFFFGFFLKQKKCEEFFTLFCAFSDYFFSDFSSWWENKHLPFALVASNASIWRHLIVFYLPQCIFRAK